VANSNNSPFASSPRSNISYFFPACPIPSNKPSIFPDDDLPPLAITKMEDSSSLENKSNIIDIPLTNSSSSPPNSNGVFSNSPDTQNLIPLSLGIITRIADTYLQHSAVHHHPFIPIEKETPVRRYLKIRENTSIVVLYDTTLPDYSKEGFCMTLEGFHWKNSSLEDPFFVSWSTIKPNTVWVSDKGVSFTSTSSDIKVVDIEGGNSALREALALTLEKILQTHTRGKIPLTKLMMPAATSGTNLVEAENNSPTSVRKKMSVFLLIGYLNLQSDLCMVKVKFPEGYPIASATIKIDASKYSNYFNRAMKLDH
jgi:hypothetical protein